MPPWSAAQKVCLFQDRVEHRREVAGRGVDDLEDLGGRSPLFQSFARLVEEARVLHRDNGLGGEVLQQRDFFIRKGPNLLAGSNDAAKERVVLAEGNCQKCTEAAQFDRIPMRRLVDRRLIVDMNERSALEQLPVGILRSGFVPLAYYFLETGGQAAGRHCADPRTVPKLQGTTGDPAKTVRLRQHRIEHRREVAGRGIDDPEHFGGCGFPFASFCQLGLKRVDSCSHLVEAEVLFFP